MVPATATHCQPLWNQSQLSTCRDLIAQLSLKIMFWCTSIMAIIGNILMWIIFSANRDVNRSRIQIFCMANFSICNLFIIFYLLIMEFADISYQTVMFGNFANEFLSSLPCSIAWFFIHLSLIASSLFMMTISVDHLLSYRLVRISAQLTMKKTIAISVFVWITSCIFSVMPILTTINVHTGTDLKLYSGLCIFFHNIVPPQRKWVTVYVVMILTAIILTTIIYVIIISSYRKNKISIIIQLFHDENKAPRQGFAFFLVWLITALPYILILIYNHSVSEQIDIILWQRVVLFTLPSYSAIMPLLYVLINFKSVKSLYTSVFNGTSIQPVIQENY